jgi:hypothetical protein
MQKFIGWLILIAVIGLPTAYGIHLWRNYAKIDQELRANTARVIHPKVDDDDVSEIGYVYQMRREWHIRDGELNLVWFVVVPATNVHYSCVYTSGYPDFKTGDSVRIIHNKDEDESDYGYLVGMHDNRQGKTTLVWTINSDDAAMELDEEDTR